MEIFICPCQDKEKSIRALPEIVGILKSSGCVTLFDERIKGLYSDDRLIYLECGEAIKRCDMLLTIGGDGMILKWGRKAAAAGKPLVGINTGRLGFMTAVDMDRLDKLTALCNGDYSISRRMMLSAEICSEGKKRSFNVLNDIVLFKNVGSKLPEYVVRINGTVVTNIRADGLIISTPTGSTAYALSAGGPIIAPEVECIELTALCAHTLWNRPMIFSSSDTVSITHVRYEHSSVNMSADGREGIDIVPGEEIVIRRSETAFDLVEIGGRGFYSTVNEKLMTPIK